MDTLSTLVTVSNLDIFGIVLRGLKPPDQRICPPPREFSDVEEPPQSEQAAQHADQDPGRDHETAPDQDVSVRHLEPEALRKRELWPGARKERAHRGEQKDPDGENTADQ